MKRETQKLILGVLCLSLTVTCVADGYSWTNNLSELPQISQNGSSDLTITNNLMLSANTTVGGSGNGPVILSGTLSGMGSLTKTNSGLLTLNSLTNTFSGGLTINTGRVSCGNPSSYLFGTGRVTVNPGANLSLNGNNNITNALTLNAAAVDNGNSFSANLNGPITMEATSSFNFGTTGNMSLGGKISGPGGLTKLGRGQGPLVITGSNTFAGPVSVNDGSVQVFSLNSVKGGTPTSALGAPLTVVDGTISLGFNNTPGNLIYNGYGETTDRVIKLAGTTGGATLTQAGTASGLPTSRGTSGLLKFTSNVLVPGIAGQDNRKTLTLTHGNQGQGEMSGSIGDSVLGNDGQRATSVTKAGVGTWTLSGANTYSGTTHIQAGTLAFTRADALGSNALEIADGAKARLDYIGTRQIGVLTFNAGAAQPSGTYGSSRSLATVKDDVHFSGLGTLTVGPIASPTTTTLALTSGANPGAAGAVLTFTAKVSGAKPTGSVIFYDGLTCIGTDVLNRSSQTSVSISTLAGGTHAITALYAGNAPSASAALSQIVKETRPSTTTVLALTGGANPSAKGAAVTFTATVTGAKPRGAVTFYEGTTALGSSTLNGSGLASLKISILSPGWRMITARYEGDKNNAPSASTPPRVQTVNPSTGNGKLKVFILAGQSNMVGYGSLENGRDPNNLTGAAIPGGMGSLRHMLNSNPDTYAYLADPDHPIAGGNPGWITRPDVWITYYGGSSWDLSPNKSRRNGNLDANYGADAANGLIGPEYGFGLVVGSQLADQVLLIKYAHGGRSLAGDFRPPSSGGTVGPCYTDMIGAVHKVLNNIAAEFPAYAGGGYEIVGLGWHQGWNDRCSAPMVAEYEKNMVNLIKDLRKEFAAPNMRVAIANTGMANAPSGPGSLIEAQGNVANPTLHPELAGTVATADTRPFDYGELSGCNNQGFHWYWSGESYFKIGESMGQAMMTLLGSSAEAANAHP
jgi:alpha-galactosidase